MLNTPRHWEPSDSLNSRRFPHRVPPLRDNTGTRIFKKVASRNQSVLNDRSGLHNQPSEVSEGLSRDGHRIDVIRKLRQANSRPKVYRSETPIRRRNSLGRNRKLNYYFVHNLELIDLLCFQPVFY
uniref:Uncharacterized protein LOC114339375 n=1 Tax=Diabrotica virgifera virgifera TaxID=50390 RepID=A0A6P7GKS3_DIAVI